MNKVLIPFNNPPYQVDDNLKSEIIKDFFHEENLDSACTLLSEIVEAPVVLTKSCTHSLEVIAKLCELNPGDEVIVPAFAHSSLPNAFIKVGAKIVFADSSSQGPNVDPVHIESLIRPKTRVVAIVHYAGFACDLKAIRALVKKHDLLLVEDAAHAIACRWNGKHLGTIGDFGAISFHETKNIGCEEGGALLINCDVNQELLHSLLDKGTNRRAFFKGVVNRYQWVSDGSAYRMSNVLAGVLRPQLEKLEVITNNRMDTWKQYYTALRPIEKAGLINLPADNKAHNAHIFYFVMASEDDRQRLIDHLLSKGIIAAFHYQSLSESPMARNIGAFEVLKHAHEYQERLLRLPLFYGMQCDDVQRVTDEVCSYYGLES